MTSLLEKTADESLSMWVYGDSKKRCICAQALITMYQKRLSGPLLDRIDTAQPHRKIRRPFDRPYRAVRTMLGTAPCHRTQSVKLEPTVADLAKRETLRINPKLMF